MPLVSVVMPVFNPGQAIEAAITSIRHQTLTDWELVVADDGSNPETLARLKTWADAEPRMRLLQRPHEGIVAALNAGLAAARGQFIARMDADDVAHPERLAAQVAFLQAHPRIGVVGTQVAFGGDRSSARGYALHVDWLNQLLSPEQIALNRFVESPLAHPSVMFRRELVQRLGGYRAGDFPEDYELWLRWLEAGVLMAKVDRVLLTWNDPPDRLSRRDARYAPEAFYRCKAPYLARWLAAHLQPGQRLWVWGAGRPTRKRAEWLVAQGVAIEAYVDIDPAKIGRRLAGRPVFGPDQLPSPAEVFVLGYVASRGARELIRSHLRSRQFIEGQHFLMAA
jgi:glycosyltransferase involved in cell wall biosynthesis